MRCDAIFPPFPQYPGPEFSLEGFLHTDNVGYVFSLGDRAIQVGVAGCDWHMAHHLAHRMRLLPIHNVNGNNPHRAGADGPRPAPRATPPGRERLLAGVLLAGAARFPSRWAIINVNRNLHSAQHMDRNVAPTYITLAPQYTCVNARS
jgi:hypothetical protein